MSVNAMLVGGRDDGPIANLQRETAAVSPRETVGANSLGLSAPTRIGAYNHTTVRGRLRLAMNPKSQSRREWRVGRKKSVKQPTLSQLRVARTGKQPGTQLADDHARDAKTKFSS